MVAVSPGCRALWDRVPSSPMPRPAFQQPYRREPTAAHQPVLGQCVDGVLATGRGESTRRQPQRRDGVPVQLNHEDDGARRPRRPHRATSDLGLTRRRAVRSSCSSRADIACRLLGRARITTRSAGSSSSTSDRATWRSRRETRWRCTAVPTALETTRPIRGPGSERSSDRRACTTRSGCTARTPRLTVFPNSVDRVMRYRAGSTSVNSRSKSRGSHAVSLRRPLLRRFVTIARPARVRIRSRKPCTRARRRLFGWKVRLPLATAVSLLRLALAAPTDDVRIGLDAVAVGKLVHLASRRGPRSMPGSQPYRLVRATVRGY